LDLFILALKIGSIHLSFRKLDLFILALENWIYSSQFQKIGSTLKSFKKYYLFNFRSLLVLRLENLFFEMLTWGIILTTMVGQKFFQQIINYHAELVVCGRICIYIKFHIVQNLSENWQDYIV